MNSLLCWIFGHKNSKFDLGFFQRLIYDYETPRRFFPYCLRCFSRVPSTEAALQAGPEPERPPLHEPLSLDEIKPFRAGASYNRAIDVIETSSELVVLVEVPGVEPARIEVAVVGAHLVVSGERGDG